MPVDTSLLNRILIADGMMSPDKLEEFLPLRGTTSVSGGVRGKSTMQPEMIGRQGGEGFFTQIGKAFNQLGKALETPGFRETLARIGGSIAAPGSWQQRLGGETAAINKEQAQMGASQNVMAKVLGGQQLTAADFQGLTPEQSAQVTQLSMERARNEAVAQYYQGSLTAQGTPESRAEEERRNMILQQALEEGAPRKEWDAVVGPSGQDKETLYRINPFTGETVPVSSGTTTRSTGGGGGDPAVQYRQWYQQAVREAMNSPELAAYGKFIQDPITGQPNIQWDNPIEGRNVLDRLVKSKLQLMADQGLIPQSYVDLISSEESEFIGPPVPKNLNAGKVKIGAY